MNSFFTLIFNVFDLFRLVGGKAQIGFVPAIRRADLFEYAAVYFKESPTFEICYERTPEYELILEVITLFLFSWNDI
jgi:hypothetical protein